jgi:DNA ligase (NAD+)
VCSVLGRITYAAARDCLDIEGLGVEVATALVESGKVSDIADLFDLTVADLANLEMNGRNLGQANAAKIHAEIVKAKGAQFGRVVCALGLRQTGRTMSRRLAAAFPTMDALIAATPGQLSNVDGIGSVKADTIYGDLFSMRAVIARLAAARVNMGTETTAPAVDLPLAGMTIVVSGSVPGLSRTEAAEVIEANGGKASSGVSAATSLLVADPSTSSKYVKAQSLGVRTVTPIEFLAMIGR